VFSLWGGIVADRADRRKVMFAAQSGMALLSAALAGLTFAGRETLLALYALNAALAAVSAFDNPARQALIPRLVPPEDLPGALSLNLTMFHAALIVGPGLAGLLIAGHGAGVVPVPARLAGAGTGQDTGTLALIYALNALSFLAVLVSLSMMRGGSAPAARAADLSTRATMREGLAYAWSSRSIRSLLLLLAVCAGLGFQYNVLLPVYARDVLHAGAEVYGWLFSAFGIGSLVAALRMAVTRERWALRWHLLIGLTTAGAGLAGFAWARWLPAMLAFAALAGFGLILYVSSTNTLIQLTVEDRYRGRVMALYTLFFVGTSPFGSLLAGAVAQRWGAPIATSICAVVLLGGALWVSFRLREVAAREAAERAAAEREVPEPESPA